MAWNGIGSYVLSPTYSPEINGTVIDATRYNGLTSDIATGISACLAKNGENAATGNLPMGGFKHTGAGVASGTGQYVVYDQLTDDTDELQGAGLVGYDTGLTYLAGSVGYELQVLQAQIDDKRIVQNIKSANYTTILTDAGKCIYQPSSDASVRAFVIADNADVAYPVGTPISFNTHRSAGGVLISCVTDTLTWAVDGSTGLRGLAPGGFATAVKIAATEWVISGAGLE
jgi:hypothetical protein